MAEFTEVMRQARRMCMDQEDCESCPIWDTAKSFCRIGAACKSDDGETEHIVMAWAAEHPEPQYPSWRDGWKQLFPDADSVPCPDQCFAPYVLCPSYAGCEQCHAAPMTAEIAEKLGIKPITEKRPVPEHDGCDGCKYEKLEEADEPCAHCKGTAGTPEVYRARRDCYEPKEG